MSPRQPSRELRASDYDREQVIALLSAALTDGRLTQQEHSDRIHRALSARTLGELTDLTRDLAAAADQPVRVDGGKVILGLFGTEARTGRWVVPPVLTAAAVCGETVVDVTAALLRERHTLMYAYALGGRIRLIVPDGVEVVVHGTTIAGRHRGGTALSIPETPDRPVIEVHAFCVVGEVLVKTPPKSRRWLPLGRKKNREIRS